MISRNTHSAVYNILRKFYKISGLKNLQKPKSVLPLQPAKEKTFIEFGIEAQKNKFQNYFQKACSIKNKSYFCTRFETQAEEIRIHVHRHIGLTTKRVRKSFRISN